MFRNYLAAALRNLMRNRLYAAINIIGLAVGFAAALLIGLYVREEFSYDTWMPGQERIFLVRETLVFPGRTPIESQATPVELAEKLKLDFPEIKAIARLSQANVAVRRGDIEANETAFWADPNIFDVLPLPVAFGDAKTALAEPTGVVLTRRMARKYFGRDDVVGETIEINRTQSVRVAAVLEDLPSNSHLTTEIMISGLAPFSFLAQRKANPLPPAAWNSAGATYLRLEFSTAAAKLDAAMPDFLARNMKAAIANFAHTALYLLPVSRIHLDPENGGTAMKPTTDPNVLYALSATGVFILLIAGINFVNLMTARAARRALEVGVRKSTGANRSDLVVQFLGESLLYAIAGAVIAVTFVVLFFPTFNAFLDRNISLLQGGTSLVLATIGMIVFVGVAAGFYPAFVLSAYRPAGVLKNAAVTAGGSGRVRKALVILQFALLIGLVVGVAVVYRQSAFALKDGLRLDKDQKLIVATSCVTPFPDRVRALPGVTAAACSTRSGLELGNGNGSVFREDGREAKLANFGVDFGYFELYDLKPLAGRLFDRNFGSDLPPAPPAPGTAPTPPDPTIARPVVINETAMRHLGFDTPQAAVGQSLYSGGTPEARGRRVEIIGVVRDFSFDSIFNLVAPGLYNVQPRGQWLTVKLTGRDLPETLAALDQAWKETGEPRPIRRLFLDQEVQKMYLGIIRQSYLFSVFGGIALLIAALGLFGLSAFTAESRTKEIGIRKAMGASTTDILRLLLWQFTKPVLWANLIAWPAAYLIMRRWLESFAYHIDLSPWMFLAASVLAVVIAVFTVIGHALMVARAKPATSLRYE